MKRFTLTFVSLFLTGSACGVIVIWADVAQWGGPGAGDIMAGAFLISMVVGLIGASMMVKP